MTNSDFEKIVDTSDEWITTRTGIKLRHVASRDQACSDLCTIAARRAMEMAGVEAEDLNAIVVGTVSGDMRFPSTAVFVQEQLGAKNAVAYDVSAACSGFIFGLHTGHGLVVSGQAKKVLVVGAEVMSKIINYKDRSTCVLFGDGAGAVIIEGCPGDEGIQATYMKSDGGLADLLCIPGGGSRSPFTTTTFEEGTHYLTMKGDGVFKWAVRAMEGAARTVVESAGMTLDDVAAFIPHQANIRIIDAVVDRLGMEKEKVSINLPERGNTSSATIPTAYDEWVRSGRIKKGDVVVFAGFGGGFTWGATLLKHGDLAI